MNQFKDCPKVDFPMSTNSFSMGITIIGIQAKCTTSDTQTIQRMGTGVENDISNITPLPLPPKKNRKRKISHMTAIQAHTEEKNQRVRINLRTQ